MIRLSFNFKIFFFIKAFIVSLIIFSNAYANENKEDKNLVYIGSHNAIVKIKIFSSFTCPHCAEFHLEVIPKIKKKYVKTGLVQLIFIDFPLDQAAFNVSKLLHCVDKKNQIKFMDNIYKNQIQWTSGSNIEDINNNLKKIVKIFGIDNDQFEKCLINETISDKILNARIEAGQQYSINATPTIVINEKKFDESKNFKNIQKRIEKII